MWQNRARQAGCGRSAAYKELYPEFTATDLVHLPDYRIYLKLVVDGMVTKVFSAVTMTGGYEANH